jgi:phage tail-like protein
MTAAEYLPAPARPPHDPYRLLLNHRMDWHISSLSAHIETAIADGALVLQPLPTSGRHLNEASGSFGGLTTPSNVAIAADGSVFLLDRTQGRLMRFDPCECRFDPIPCLGGVGEAPRQVSNSGGIGICGGNLYIADAGNRRTAVYSLHGFALRGFWYPPRDKMKNPWEPVDVSFDSRGYVLIADRSNGCVHLFNPGGRWLKSIDGIGAVQAIVTDCANRLYVFIDTNTPVKIYNLATEKAMGDETRVDMVADRFAALPFAVTSEGHLHLGVLCYNASDQTTLFDLRGDAITNGIRTDLKIFESKGTYISDALDSRLYRCQWDRLSLKGLVPAGTRIVVHTYTAETELSPAQIEGLADLDWSTAQTVMSGKAFAGWDCLIRSEGGRYLWLKLTFISDGMATPRIEQLILDYPRISLRRYLPTVFGQEPEAADFTDRFLAVFDRGFRQIEQQLDHLAHLFDPLSAPAAASGESGRLDFFSWLATWVGITIDRHLPLPRQRRLLKEAGKLFHLRGTPEGLRRLLALYLGLDQLQCTQKPSCGPCTTRPPDSWQPPQLILEHFKLRRWLFLGAGRLGDQAELWGQKIINRSRLSGPQINGNARLGVTQLKTTQDPFRDSFHEYSHKFSVFVPGQVGCSPRRRKALERLIDTEKPAHTHHQLILVEPRFRIGIQSMIGYDAVVGCYPEGIILNQSGLGKASVLGPAHEGGPSLQVGINARIGTTTKLN